MTNLDAFDNFYGRKYVRLGVNGNPEYRRQQQGGGGDFCRNIDIKNNIIVVTDVAWGVSTFASESFTTGATKRTAVQVFPAPAGSSPQIEGTGQVQKYL